MKKLIICSLLLLSATAPLQAKIYASPGKATEALADWIKDWDKGVTSKQVEEAIAAGADVNKATAMGPFIIGAISNGQKNIFDALLNHKDIDLDARSALGVTLLDIAAGKDDLYYINQLLAHPKFDKNMIKKTLFTGVGIARQNIKALNMILSSNKLDQDDIKNAIDPAFDKPTTVYNMRLLYDVIKGYNNNTLDSKERSNQLKIFLQNPKININAVDNKKKTLLHYVSEAANKDVQDELFSTILADSKSSRRRR